MSLFGKFQIDNEDGEPVGAWGAERIEPVGRPPHDGELCVYATACYVEGGKAMWNERIYHRQGEGVVALALKVLTAYQAKQEAW